jgi:integrase
MGRPSLPLGTFGKIRTYVEPTGGYTCRTLFRDFDGVTRHVERTAKSKAAAERVLREALRDRAYAGRDIDITPNTKVAVVAEAWFRRFSDQSASPSTLQAYRDRLDRQIIPSLGNLQVRELTVGLVDRHLQAVRASHGPGTAKMVRSVLSGILGHAARHDAIAHNPVRDAGKISVDPAGKPRALTIDEAQTLRTALRADDRAVQRDLVDLVDLLLCTGLRIGEAVAMVWDGLDLDAGTVEVRGTVVRVKGEGLIIKPAPKTKAGFRVLQLPQWAVAALERRSQRTDIKAGPTDPVFCAQLGGLRDPSNTHAALRDAFDRAGFDWVTSHTFRKTVATRMDQAGLSARAAADQLGHAQPSMTQDVYFGRKARVTGAATLLEALG